MNRKTIQITCAECKNPSYGRKGQKFCSFKCSVANKKGVAPKNITSIQGWNKGKTGWMSDEMRETARIRMTGHKYALGNRFTAEQRAHLSEVHMGQIAWNKGLQGIMPSGPDHPRWIADRTKLARRNGRGDTAASVTWANTIRRRDKWKCRLATKDCSGPLEVHHILPVKEFPEERYNNSNGITLCRSHHPRKRQEVTRLVPVLRQIVLDTH